MYPDIDETGAKSENLQERKNAKKGKEKVLSFSLKVRIFLFAPAQLTKTGKRNFSEIF